MEKPLRVECRHFLHWIRNRERPRTDGANGLRVLEILDLPRRSLQEKGRVLQFGRQGHPYIFCGASMVFTNVINPRSFSSRRKEFKQTLVRRGAPIGANATLLCGHAIGRYALMGAGAVVAGGMPDYAIMAGNPAKVIGHVRRCGVGLEFDGSVARCSHCGLTFGNHGWVVSPL